MLDSSSFVMKMNNRIGIRSRGGTRRYTGRSVSKGGEARVSDSDQGGFKLSRMQKIFLAGFALVVLQFIHVRYAFRAMDGAADFVEDSGDRYRKIAAQAETDFSTEANSVRNYTANVVMAPKQRLWVLSDLGGKRMSDDILEGRVNTLIFLGRVVKVRPDYSPPSDVDSVRPDGYQMCAELSPLKNVHAFPIDITTASVDTMFEPRAAAKAERVKQTLHFMAYFAADT